MFARVFGITPRASLLFTLLAGALAVGCGGAPEPGSESATNDPVQADRALAPTSCHGAANADGVVGVTCDAFSPVATSYTLERFEGSSWIPVHGPSGKTPDLIDEGSSDVPTGNGPPPAPYPHDYHIRAEVPEGYVYSDPIEVSAPQ